MMTRRHLLAAGAVGAIAASAARSWAAGAPAAPTFKVTRTDAEWRKSLNPRQYAVLRQSDTEEAFTSPLLKEHRHGVFSCAGCKQDLFSSTTKFESGTGWPSFWAPIDKTAVLTTRDTSFGMVRTAVDCSGCGGHLGHVFDDGPKPTGLRYCMNGLAMSFRPTPA